MPRTQQQIIDQIQEYKAYDMFGTMASDLISFLDWEHAKPFLIPEAVESEWNQLTDPIKEIKNYMEFAWDKANNFRALSARRSLQHMLVWGWLSGDPILGKITDIDEYEYYGKNILQAICEHLEIDHMQWDDGVRSNTEE